MQRQDDLKEPYVYSNVSNNDGGGANTQVEEPPPPAIYEMTQLSTAARISRLDPHCSL